MGTMAVYADPTGAVFGTWQSGTHTGYNLYNEPGAVLWSEAMVGDFDVAREFYPPSLATSTRTSPWRM